MLTTHGLFYIIFIAGVLTSWSTDFMQGGWSLLFGVCWFHVSRRIIIALVVMLGWVDERA
jgi:uncharacterized membrane protein